mmetsp:Transcript_54609/g.63046  ORF Transcript_54609/g.63046 Transcript_54609/m.63046 type:complete len:487 (-) Transcript_54609:321-1781(-)
MADQKAAKKRLKALMQQPENQICSDCSEKRPTWASLIAPPPGTPPGTEKIGSFCCLECSGSHRRLGVHIAFVRSVNLDSWKEWEVRAMENGGNAKVNAIFEAQLAQSGKKKPTNLADGPTRERYIRDKYERRKFYDPAGYSIDSRSVASHVGGGMIDGGKDGSNSRPGAPSDIARQRVANRQARMKNTKSNTIAAQPPPVRVAPSPVSAPVEFDLLDFGAETDAAPAPTPSAAVIDPFSTQATAPWTQTNQFVSGRGHASAIPPAPKTAPPLTTSFSLKDESTTSHDDIMALFNPSKQQQNQQQSGFGMQAMDHMVPGAVANNNNNMMMMNGILSQQHNQSQQGSNMMTYNNQRNSMQQQQQQQMMMQMQNNNMMASGNQQQMMMNPMMLQQQQQVPNQGQTNYPGAMNMYNVANNGLNNSMAGAMNTNTNMNTPMHSMQNANTGNKIVRQTSEDGGFGVPMGGSSQQHNTKTDAFSSLGGMNAFR